ncbi:MAG: hypothetical protein HY531_02705, partial [Chloroflexi bacterium]|nr:hypothetical protein [Chloroflexota bacterium]
MFTPFRSRKAVLAISLVLLFMIACGPAAAPTPTKATAPAAAPTATATSVPVAPKRGGKITIVARAEPITLSVSATTGDGQVIIMSDTLAER